MATQEEIDSLRRKAQVDNTAPYTDIQLGVLIDNGDSINMVAAEIWAEKAAAASTLVDVSESGSSRSLSQTSKNALAMSKFWKDQDVEVAVELTGRTATTRNIVREGE